MLAEWSSCAHLAVILWIIAVAIAIPKIVNNYQSQQQSFTFKVCPSGMKIISKFPSNMTWETIYIQFLTRKLVFIIIHTACEGSIKPPEEVKSKGEGI